LETTVIIAVVPAGPLEETTPLVLTDTRFELLDHVTPLLLAFAGLTVKASCTDLLLATVTGRRESPVTSCTTVTVIDADLPEPSPAVARITVFPGPTAVMRPVDALTDAIDAFRDVQTRGAVAGAIVVTTVEEEPTARASDVCSFIEVIFTRAGAGARVITVPTAAASRVPLILPSPVHLS
jgi:hypothetical protein